MNNKSITLTSNQNFYSDNLTFEEKPSKELQSLVGTRLTTAVLQSDYQYENIVLYSFNNAVSDEEKLVLEVCKNIDGKIYIKTGLYIGEINFKGLTFIIKPNLYKNDSSDNDDKNNSALHRMLNYANNIFISKNYDEIQKRENKNKNRFPLFEYLFLTSLQKSFILGLPAAYKKEHFHNLNFRGTLDIKNFINKDIPFKGKLSYKVNERNPVQCIIDVLYFALSLIDNEITSYFTRLKFIKSELKSLFSGIRPTQLAIDQAKKHPSLANPMYTEFQKTLKYAELVINKNNTSSDNTNSDNTISGYLLDISSLWEAYLTGVLKKYMPDWTVRTQKKMELYPGMFYSRNNYPDIILEREEQIIVLDAKFKHMNYSSFDVDRTDLFQIHSYIGYYNLIPSKKVLAGGLIYPLQEEIDESIAHSDKLYGSSEITTDIKFIIDGIYFGDDIDKSEVEFVKRINSLLY